VAHEVTKKFRNSQHRCVSHYKTYRTYKTYVPPGAALQTKGGVELSPFRTGDPVGRTASGSPAHGTASPRIHSATPSVRKARHRGLNRRILLRMRLSVIFPVLCVVLIVALEGLSATGPGRVAASRCPVGAIHLDGVLDEDSWKTADTIPGLTQQDPSPGESTPYDTTIRFVVDSSAVYIGIQCHDPEPERIAVHTMQRDGNMRGDDTVSLVLDTFGDHRTGYFFQINASGTRQDGLISGPEDISLDWDGIWDTRTRRTADGWTAEIVIPAQTLRFTPGKDTWGLNVQREIPRDRLTLRWQGAVLNAALIDLRRAGLLSGVGGLEQGKGLSISPYALVRSIEDLVEDESGIEGDAGLDLTYNLTPDLSAVVTINTDFAETEVDSRQVNLTRFALFFPEKRPFFLEGSSLFNFGTGLGYDFIPFFSRRIGLFEGEQVPIDGGIKVLGRSGKWGVGVLDVLAGDSEQTDSTNLFSGRITYDVDSHLTVGTIVTDGDPGGVSDNSLFGVDAIWRTATLGGDKNFSVGGWAAVSTGDIPEGQDYGWGLKVDYPNDLWDVFFTVKEFGDALDPALGFLPRPGTRWYQGGGAYQPRPKGGLFGWTRQMYFELFTTYITDLDGQVESWRVFTAPFNVQTDSGEHLEANVVPQFERLDEPFEISEGVIIPPGEYHFTRYRLEAQSSRHRPWRIGCTWWFGDFYSGTLDQIESFISYTTPSGHLQLQLNSEYDSADLPEGEFIQNLWQLKTVYAFSPEKVLSFFAQYDSDSRMLGVNARYRWTFQPGRDLFVVWNHDWERPVGAEDPFRLRPLYDQFVVKLRWTFRY